MFNLLFVYHIFVRFWLLSGHLLGNSYPLGWPLVPIVCLYFDMINIFFLWPVGQSIVILTIS